MAEGMVETADIELDKPLEEMSVEELQAMHDASVEGETEESEPSEATEDITAETDDDAEEPTQDDDSNEADANDVSEGEMLKAMRKEMDGLQKMFARTQTELGESRKLTETLQDLVKSQHSESDEEVDPYEDADKFIDKKFEQREARKAAAIQAEQMKVREAKDYVESKIPEFSNMVDDMSNEIGDIFKDDPEVNTYVNNFKSNPYVLDSLTLVFAGKAAEYKRQIAELQEKVSGSDKGKGELISKIKNLGRTKSPIGRGSNSSTNGRVKSEFSPKKIEAMGIEELEKLYASELEN